jgi:signal transduction histidine kinase
MTVLSESTFAWGQRRETIASRRLSATFIEVLQAVADRYLTPPRAMALSLTLFALAAFGDFATTAETTFTLFYVVPLAIAVWYTGLRAGYVIAGLSVLSGLFVDAFGDPSPPSWFFLVWNNLIDGALFVVFAHVFAALRTRVRLESELRMDALDQLRHAERLTTIGKLASGIAHEIGTPLNVISGHAELLLMGRLGPNDIKTSGKVLLEQSERVSTIVRQLLDFARRGGTRVEMTDINQLVGATAELLTSLARKTGIEILVEGDPVSAAVNRSELQQVLTNVITNAIHAMPKGGKINIEIHKERTSPPEQKRGSQQDYVVVSVRDSGTGIAPDVLPKIFDPFFTTKDVGEGTGLGLSVAYGIVRDHHGWFSVNTRLGEGTTLSVYLPHKAPETDSNAAV